MKIGNKLVAVALVIVAIILVNFIVSRLPLRVDATAGGIYTLSPGTKSLLSKIETPLALDFYFSRDAAGLPTSYKNYASRVQELLRQYVRASSGKITLNIITPQADTPEEERAAAAGLQAQTINATGETIYFGLVAIQADQEKNIPAFTPQREAFLEYDISQLIHGVQLVKKPRLGLISSLPLAAPPPNMMMLQQRQRMPQPQFVYTEWSRNCEIVTIDPATTPELPANLDALAIIHPQGIPEKLQYAIDQFILAGHPVLLALDPSSQHARRSTNQQAMMMGMPPQDISSDLPRFLKTWGVTYDPNRIVGDNKLATTIQTGRAVERYPVWLTLTAENLNRAAQPTAQLNTLLFAEPGSFAIDTAATGLTATPLIETTDQAGDAQRDALQFAQPGETARLLTPSGKKVLAVQLTGKFKTAFPDGAPKKTDANDKPDDAAANAPADKPAGQDAAAKTEHLAEGSSTVILVADTDWLFDDFGLRKFNFLGTEAVEPFNNNLAFASNIADIIAGSTDLVTLRGKGAVERPFTVVRDMQAAAEKKYQAKLAELETRITEVQGKLGELMGRTSEGNRLVATPEIQKAIEDFQKQEVQMRRERREIRRSLREDIDALEYRLAAINILLIPALILAGAWLFQRARRK